MKIKNRGIALLIVLSTILVIVLLANIILTVMLSNTRLTQHQINRIQAYYAAQAGMNYALEKLRMGDAAWTTAKCGSGCNLPTDTSFPSAISQPIKIILTAPGAALPAGAGTCPTILPTGGACITVNVDYQKPSS